MCGPRKKPTEEFSGKDNNNNGSKLIGGSRKLQTFWYADYRVSSLWFYLCRTSVSSLALSLVRPPLSRRLQDVVHVTFASKRLLEATKTILRIFFSFHIVWKQNKCRSSARVSMAYKKKRKSKGYFHMSRSGTHSFLFELAWKFIGIEIFAKFFLHPKVQAPFSRNRYNYK